MGTGLRGFTAGAKLGAGAPVALGVEEESLARYPVLDVPLETLLGRARRVFDPGPGDGHVLLFPFDTDEIEPLIHSRNARGTRAHEVVQDYAARRGDEPDQPGHEFHGLRGWMDILTLDGRPPRIVFDPTGIHPVERLGLEILEAFLPLGPRGLGLVAEAGEETSGGSGVGLFSA